MPDVQCSKKQKVSKIKVSENGKQAIFLNPDREEIVTTRVDGCLVKQSTACDWLIVRRHEESILVELKGCDVSHALDQISATFDFLRRTHALTGRMAALVVCKNPPRHPLFTTKLQRLKNRLSQDFRAPLHVVCGNYEYSFDRVFSHHGPR